MTEHTNKQICRCLFLFFFSSVFWSLSLYRLSCILDPIHLQCRCLIMDAYCSRLSSSSPSSFNLPLAPLLILPKSSRFHRNPGLPSTDFWESSNLSMMNRWIIWFFFVSGRLCMKGSSRNWNVIIWFPLWVFFLLHFILTFELNLEIF